MMLSSADCLKNFFEQSNPTVLNLYSLGAPECYGVKAPIHCLPGLPIDGPLNDASGRQQAGIDTLQFPRLSATL